MHYVFICSINNLRYLLQWYTKGRISQNGRAEKIASKVFCSKPTEEAYLLTLNYTFSFKTLSLNSLPHKKAEKVKLILCNLDKTDENSHFSDLMWGQNWLFWGKCILKPQTLLWISIIRPYVRSSTEKKLQIWPYFLRRLLKKESKGRLWYEY